MRSVTFRIDRVVATALAAVGLLALSSCAAAPPPPPEPQKDVVWLAPANPPPPDEWNLFPDPTTGEVDVYHQGDFVGAITGNEPADQDPPLPHPVAPAQ
ncbi:MAG TPA: hypothetical protein VEU51_08715 [Candidatus Acidoferrales bacterium]|nr:hypothetical protein [Candidatus Acidoferrales bacterium]